MFDARQPSIEPVVEARAFDIVRAAIVALAWVGWYVIVPLAIGSTLTGVLLGLLGVVVFFVEA